MARNKKVFFLFRLVINFVEAVTQLFKSDKQEPPVPVEPMSTPERPRTEMPEIQDPRSLPYAQTKHFDQSEFVKPGTILPSELVDEIQRIMYDLEVIRSAFGGNALIITRAFSTPLQNDEVGGVSDSTHLTAEGVDFVIRNIHPSIVFEGCLKLIDNKEITPGGLGGYDDHTHYDHGRPRIWDERTKKQA